MVKKLEDVIKTLPVERRKKVEARAIELASLKDLRRAAEQTQHDMALALGVRQDTISRLEKRSDMLLSTLRHYIECMGGTLELVARFPDRPPIMIDQLGMVNKARQPTRKPSARRKASSRPTASKR